MTTEPVITGSQDFIPGAGANFNLVGTSQIVVVRETLEATCTTCGSGSSPVGCISIRVNATLSDMSGRLSIAVIS
jgi:hypothetical protein